MCIVFNYVYLIELYGVIKYLRTFGLFVTKSVCVANKWKWKNEKWKFCCGRLLVKVKIKINRNQRSSRAHVESMHSLGCEYGKS